MELFNDFSDYEKTTTDYKLLMSMSNDSYINSSDPLIRNFSDLV